MTTVTINNNEQKQVEQRMLVNQLVDNGLMSSVGKIYKRGGMRGLAKKAGSIGGGMARKAGGAMKTQVKAAGIQAKRAGLRAKNFGSGMAKSAKEMRGLVGATVGGSAGFAGGAYVGAKSQKRKK